MLNWAIWEEEDVDEEKNNYLLNEKKRLNTVYNALICFSKLIIEFETLVLVVLGQITEKKKKQKVKQWIGRKH